MDGLSAQVCRVAPWPMTVTTMTWTIIAAASQFVIFVSCDAPQSLRFVNVLYRHGDRSPISTFPNDVYQADSWPQGFGQLTTKGMRRCYGLGEFLRQRYSAFLNDTYHRDEIRVLSTEYERAMQSAAVVLAGLYAKVPPGDMIQSGLPWLPVPIHSGVYGGFFFDSSMTKSSCLEKSVTEMKDNVKKYLWAQYPILLTSLRNLSGFDDIAMDYHIVSDALLCEQSDGRTLPEWAAEAMHVYYNEVAPWASKLSTDTLKKRQRLARILFARMLHDMRSMMSDVLVDHPPKMMMYSGHDTSVIQLLVAMDAFNNLPIPFSTTVLLELHESDSDVKDGRRPYFVRLFYRNDTDREPYALTIPGCAVDCPFEEFVNLTKPFDVDAPVIDCVDDDDYLFDRLVVVVILSASLGALLLVIGLITLCASRNRRGRRAWRMTTLGGELAPAPPLHYRKFYENSDVPEEVPMMTSDFDDSA